MTLHEATDRMGTPMTAEARERAWAEHNGHREAVEVAIVGGGPAGAALATRLADAGHDVVLFERLPQPRWRASGVYSSPDTYRALRELGLPRQRLDALVRPIDEMAVESLSGVTCRLVYGPPDHAVGLDRVRLERAMLDRAASAGARVEEGRVVRAVRWGDATGAGPVELDVAATSGGPELSSRWRAGVVVGADGPRSLVAHRAGVVSTVPLLRKAGLTVHRNDPGAAAEGEPMGARMVVGKGWYCGIGPVPGGRVNVGVVVDGAGLKTGLRRAGGSRGLIGEILTRVPDRGEAWRGSADTDEVRAAFPLAHRVSRASGNGFLLVGDAAGFIDPISGEGVHRALVSAELAADAIAGWARGDRSAIRGYDHQLRGRFGRKDTLSWLFQLFMSRPLLFDYALRRLSRRERLRRTFGLVVADLAPPERAMHPRFLASLLMP